MAVFILPGILMFFYATAALHFRYTPDDTYVYLQFARNVINGDGMSFTPGVPTYGITAPLWMGLISLGGLMKIDLLVTAKLVDLFVASMALLVFFFVAYELIRDLFTAIAATLTFAMNVWFLQWAGTGMEISFAVLLLLGTLWFAIRNDYFTAIVLAALLGLVRPEGWLIIVPIGVDIFFNSFNKRRALKMILAMGLIFAVLILPWMIYAWLTFGSLVPNAEIAKTGTLVTLNEMFATLKGIGTTLVVSDSITGGVLLLGIALLWKRGGTVRTPDENPPYEEPVENSSFYLLRSSIIPLGWVLMVCLLDFFTGEKISSRSMLVISPVIVIFAFFFFHRVAVAVGNPRRRMIAIALLSLVAMLQNQVAYFSVIKPGIDAIEKGMESCFIPVGKWLNQNTPPGTIIFAEDIGALAYFSQRPIVDAAGVISTATHPLLLSGKTPEDLYREKSYRQLGAQYIVLRSADPAGLPADHGLAPILSDTVKQIDFDMNVPSYFTVYKVLPDSGTGR